MERRNRQYYAVLAVIPRERTAVLRVKKTVWIMEVMLLKER